MKPFFTYYGGKWRAAPRYPQPLHDTIIEPFAGAAGYAIRHFERQVILVEKDPVVAALWRYLISARREDIEALPLIRMDQSVDDLDVPAAARTLIGFWLNKGAASACKTPSKWMREGLRPKSFWGAEIRSRIADQVERISHWQVVEGGYEQAPNMPATWFIDPPYKDAGLLYRHSSKHLDFTHLADWCKTRQGQVMVCENEGATWLPFTPYLEIKSTEGKHGKARSSEALWQNNPLDTARTSFLTLKKFMTTNRETPMDIQINVNIGLTKGLEHFLTTLLGGQPGAPAKVEPPTPQFIRNPVAASVLAEPDVAELVEAKAEDPQPEPAKRTRRTKEQMAADAAAQATGQSGDQATSESQLTDLLDGSSTGPTATTAASPSDLAEALEQTETAVAVADDGVITLETVRAAVTAAMGKEGWSPKKVQQAMQEAIGEHAKSAGVIKPEEYPAAMQVLNKIITG